MKKSIAVIAFAATCFAIACKKDSGTVNNGISSTGTQQGTNPGHPSGHVTARFSGPHYSQSISLDTANRMLQSYFNAIGYPGVDTTIRSLSFDADTLRAYLQNPNIVTVKFMFAHPPAYMNSGFFGINGGSKPNAITMIIVGMNDEDQYILNSRNGVYDNMNPCPLQCPGNAGGYLQ